MAALVLKQSFLTLLHLEHGFGDADHCGKMKDVIRVLHGARDGFAVADVTADEFHVESVQILLVSGAEVVEDADFRLALEGFRDMAADESGASCDQNSHFFSSFLISPTSFIIRSYCCSMDSTSLNWVRQRSRLWPSR